MVFFIKIQSENIKMTWKIYLFIQIVLLLYDLQFFKCDGSAVL